MGEPQSVAGGRGVNMWLDLGLCASLLCCCTTTSDAQGFMCSAGISKQICLPDSYSKFELPFPQDVNKIYISMDIDEVLRINDKDYSITFATYFNVEWVESRLTAHKDFQVIL